MRGLVLFPLLERRESTAGFFREVLSAPLDKLPALYVAAGRRVGPSPAIFSPEEQTELVRALREAGAAGATVLAGVWGYLGAGEAHGDRFWSLRRRVPAACVCVDRPHRMRRLWPVIDRAAARAGLVTEELVPAFHATGPEARLGGLRLAAID